MRIINSAILALICFSAIAHAQEQPPKLLMHVAHCLKTKGFLPISRVTTSSFGYLLDENSYPGQKILYVVDYAPLVRSNGLVFTAVLTEKDGNQNFDIQNNARFVLSKDEFAGVSFVEPPLGGTWTQEHLASAINEIEKHAKFGIPTKSLLAAYPHVHCEAYTDR